MKLSLISILESSSPRKTSADLMNFLEIAVPFLVKNRIVQTRVLKQCSEVAPMFTHFAEKEGFEARTISAPNHYYSLVQTSDGVWKVDLTYIQFMLPCDVYEGDDEYYDEVDKLINKASEDPFSVVKIEKVDSNLPSSNAISIKPKYAEYYRNKMYGIKNTDPDWWL